MDHVQFIEKHLSRILYRGDFINRRHIGSLYEEMAVEYLLDNGYQIIKRNYYCKVGEIDIVAVKDNILCFIEVKYRKNSDYGYPTEAVTKDKQKRIRKCATWFLAEYNIADTICCSFDVIAIWADHIEYIFNAYGAM